MQAYSLIRDQPWYRREAFELGLKRAGFEVLRRSPDRGRPGEVLLIWNRYGSHHDIAERFAKDGGRVLVAENGYLGRGGTSPKFDVHPGGPQPHHYYALGVGWHNGRGTWHVGQEARFPALGVTPKPWRSGNRALVCPNRSFGVGEQVMHPDWGERTAAALRKRGLEVRVRDHPGNNEPRARPLANDLAWAEQVHIWSSSVGVHALVEGIPVTAHAPYWICKAAGDGSQDDARRAAALERMAWGQWTCAELETGEPFRRLLDGSC